MAKKPKFLSEDDLRILQRVIDRERRQIINAPALTSTERWDQGEDHQAPEVYVALPPSGGIPASTVTPISGDVPGSADCTIYQVLIESGTPRLRPITGLTKKVYNITDTAVSRVWTPVSRDKFGRWIALAGGGGGGGPNIIQFQIVTADCQSLCAIATVQARNCGDTRVGDEVLVHDAVGCFLTGSEALLEGLKGYAVEMNGSDQCAGTGTWPSQWTGTGTSESPTAGCSWHIISLCCATESC